MKALHTLLVVGLLALAACDTTQPGDIGRDVLSSDLSVLAAQAPAFGGITYDNSVQDSYGGGLLVVHTLGESVEAEAQIERLLSRYEYRLNRRPTRGEATAALVSPIEDLEPIAPIKDVGRIAHRIDFNPTTGYVEVGVWTVLAARAYQMAIEEADISMDNIILLVEDRPVSN